MLHDPLRAVGHQSVGARFHEQAHAWVGWRKVKFAGAETVLIVALDHFVFVRDVAFVIHDIETPFNEVPVGGKHVEGEFDSVAVAIMGGHRHKLSKHFVVIFAQAETTVAYMGLDIEVHHKVIQG